MYVDGPRGAPAQEKVLLVASEPVEPERLSQALHGPVPAPTAVLVVSIGAGADPLAAIAEGLRRFDAHRIVLALGRAIRRGDLTGAIEDSFGLPVLAVQPASR